MAATTSLITRDFTLRLRESLVNKPHFIHVVLGPRQVGKTTGIHQLMKELKGPSVYVSADGHMLKPSSWLLDTWLQTRSQHPAGLLVIDEIQKVENWSETIKLLWDEQKREQDQLKLILLGSSSLHLQSGLSESLAGRFIIYNAHHWTPSESHESHGLSLQDFLKFGGYPGSYELIQSRVEWLNYMNQSIIDAVIGKDILTLARVKSPSLFRQCFDLACSYAGQEISYTKLLGQLQDKGNTDLVKHYLELFEKAFLLKQLFKYSNKKVLSKSSSPKIVPLCPALYSLSLDADYKSENFGRAFEVMIGSLLSQLPGQLYYWRERNHEVDYVLQYGKKIWAIEVKWGDSKTMSGLEKFKQHFPLARLVLMNQDNYSAELAKIKSEIE